MSKLNIYYHVLLRVYFLLATLDFIHSIVFRLPACNKFDAEFSVLHSNKVLEGAIIQAFKNIEISACHQKCITFVWCRSINYCQLNDLPGTKYCQIYPENFVTKI